MIQQETDLEVADNTGAKRVRCFKVLGGTRKRYARVGDIIVCSTTDPSWVPLFLVAGGVVCDIGAPSSHAAIVSRELGVPCVVSVSRARDRIADGTHVEIDGLAGTVRILEGAPG